MKRFRSIFSRFSRRDQFQNDIFGSLLFRLFFSYRPSDMFTIFSLFVAFLCYPFEGVNSSFVFYFHSPVERKIYTYVEIEAEKPSYRHSHEIFHKCFASTFFHFGDRGNLLLLVLFIGFVYFFNEGNEKSRSFFI